MVMSIKIDKEAKVTPVEPISNIKEQLYRFLQYQSNSRLRRRKTIKGKTFKQILLEMMMKE